MRPTDLTRKHVIASYVQPARRSGQKTVRVRVGNVLKELSWTNRTPSVYSTLKSSEFQNEAGVELIEKIGGPPSGGPSTTVQFVYKVLNEPVQAPKTAKPIPNGAGLEKLYGILAREFADLGGAEAYLKAERNRGPDTWERYAMEEKARKGNRK